MGHWVIGHWVIGVCIRNFILPGIGCIKFCKPCKTGSLFSFYHAGIMNRLQQPVCIGIAAQLPEHDPAQSFFAGVFGL